MVANKVDKWSMNRGEYHGPLSFAYNVKNTQNRVLKLVSCQKQKRWSFGVLLAAFSGLKNKSSVDFPLVLLDASWASKAMLTGS